MRVCDYCGRTYEFNANNQRFCRPACTTAHWRERHGLVQRHLSPTTRVCEACHQRFPEGRIRRIESESGHGTIRLCERCFDRRFSDERMAA